jgi:AcrR family transcriptional regulator
MSPAATRSALVEVAAELLGAAGPQALTARRVAAAAGSSTTPVYRHFGGMTGLVRELVCSHLAILAGELSALGRTDDPVADLAEVALAYRRDALAAPHLYTVMYRGGAAPYERTILAALTGRVRRCIVARRFRPADAELLACQFWAAVHGTVTLELAGQLPAGEQCLRIQLRALMIGAGDSPTRAAAAAG